MVEYIASQDRCLLNIEEKESVLAKLNEKKEEVARRTGQKAMQQVMESEGERTKK